MNTNFNSCSASSGDGCGHDQNSATLLPSTTQVAGKTGEKFVTVQVWDTVGCETDNIVRVYNKDECVFFEGKLYWSLENTNVTKPGTDKWSKGRTICSALKGAEIESPTDAHFTLSNVSAPNTNTNTSAVYILELGADDELENTAPVTGSGNTFTVTEDGFLTINLQFAGYIPPGDIASQDIYSSVAAWINRGTDNIVFTEDHFTIPTGSKVPSSGAGTRGNATHIRLPVKAGDEFDVNLFVGGVGLEASDKSWLHLTHEKA